MCVCVCVCVCVHECVCVSVWVWVLTCKIMFVRQIIMLHFDNAFML